MKHWQILTLLGFAATGGGVWLRIGGGVCEYGRFSPLDASSPSNPGISGVLLALLNPVNDDDDNTDGPVLSVTMPLLGLLLFRFCRNVGLLLLRFCM
jgi:hypothetical protein